MRKLFVVLLGMTAAGSLWAASIPTTITYQGTLKVRGLPANSPPQFAMEFQLTDQTGATAYSNNLTKTVSVSNGLFSVPLDFTINAPYTWDTIDPYLQVVVNGQKLGTQPEHIGATAYAFVSKTVVDGAITRNKLDASLQNLTTPSGSIMAFAGQTAPAGWLLCDGSAVSRSAFNALFVTIGTLWGVGDGVNTFNLPDLRGRAPIGAGQGTGLTARSLGDISIGEEKHVLKPAETARLGHVHDINHKHIIPVGINGNQVFFPPTSIWGPGTTSVTLPYWVQGIAGIGAAAPVNYFYSDKPDTPNSGNASYTGTSDSDGAPFNNIQPSAVVNYIIKT